MKRLDLKAKNRSKTGKGSARSARRNGFVPAIVYGGDLEPMPVQVDRYTVEMAMQAEESENLLVNLDIEGGEKETLTLVRDTQHNPLSGDLEHMDFLRVSVDKTITTTVPLHTSGTPVGVRIGGGVFEQVVREVEIECLPMDIPDELIVDISDLDLNESLHISDIPPNEKYTILTAADRTVANVAEPTILQRQEVEEEAAEGEAEETEAAEGEAE